MEKIVETIASVNSVLNDAVWDLSDTFNGLMMLPNLIGVISLLPLVLKVTKNYVDRKIKGKDIAPMLSYDDAIQQEMALSLNEEN